MQITISGRTVDRHFTRKVEEISGQPVLKCMQCGTCSGVCPMDGSTEITPRLMIHLTCLGQRELVMNTNMSWMCASCHICEVRCPRGLDVPKIVEAIRLIKLRTNENYIEPFTVDKDEMKDMPQIALVSTFRKHTA